MPVKWSIPGSLLYLGNVWGHTTLGYKTQSALFFNSQALDVDLSSKICLVVGATAGIGKATAIELARRGAVVHIVGRDKEKGENAKREIEGTSGHQKVVLHICDISKPKDVHRFTSEFSASYNKLNILVNNAAIMQGKVKKTEDGIESSIATNVLGFYGMTIGLLPLLSTSASPSEPSRIVNVVSAGMYTQPLALDLIEQCLSGQDIGKFDGAAAYSIHHRARVALTRRWAKELRDKNIIVNCVHPGWVDTPGLRGAKPMEGFYKATKAILRSEAEGADTVVWLAAAKESSKFTGEFFYDRSPRWVDLPLAGTSFTEADVDSLVRLVDEADQRYSKTIQ
eukprot:TRINITY_DN7659_c0_g1::TRINITY_DN7659_c0_g1_i1::g.18545::m.18545 TRINITY_DN7659_c0_g1::TRINITY_DN7659_c0_g1_i1::g.18545  ORF type:complete len:339 (-),score=15.79,sp/A6QP05/DHR12_BOVIN/42.36/9e-69,adh_short/PF00106.20/5.4e-18,adh_short/PF00106.20/1.2e+03,adh_short_C2/PF13561.1/4.2e-06,adh_short_C2/PF13561.1/0.0036,KR/PF08659.5/2.1e-08,Epimerase/PF01370.16/2.8e-06,Eno-Rase_NADH_b/PF12242.3/0.001,NAD_binding_10/PF13460.1/0.031,NAD_binding_10/PF13460.1/2.3e+02,DUF1776/PF08643.5/0.28,Shikimate_DH/PF0